MRLCSLKSSTVVMASDRVTQVADLRSRPSLLCMEVVTLLSCQSPIHGALAHLHRPQITPLRC